MLTHARYIDYMTHALGRVPDPRHRLTDSLNFAGRTLYTAGQPMPHSHTWSWLVRENVRLFIPKLSDFAPLPDNFGSIVAVEEEQRVVGSVQLTDITHILELRADVTVSPLTIWLAFDVGAEQSTVDSRAQKRVAVYPQQDEDRLDIRMTYVRSWTDLMVNDDGTLSDPSAIPCIPAEWEQLLLYGANRVALQIENEDDTQYTQMYMRELARLVSYDSSRQVNYGPALHSVMDRAKGSRGFQYPHRGITRP